MARLVSGQIVVADGENCFSKHRKSLISSTAFAALVAAGLLVFVPVELAQAQSVEKHWDGQLRDNQSNDRVDGGDGVWSSLSPNNYWTNASGSRNTTFDAGDIAVFGGANGEARQGTVSVFGQPEVSDLKITRSGYTFRAFNNPTVERPNTIKLQASATIEAARATSTTFDTGLAGAGSRFNVITFTDGAEDKFKSSTKFNLNANNVFDSQVSIEGRTSIRVGDRGTFNTHNIFLNDLGRLEINSVNGLSYNDNGERTSLSLRDDSVLVINRNNTISELDGRRGTGTFSGETPTVFIGNGARLTIDGTVNSDFVGDIRDTGQSSGGSVVIQNGTAKFSGNNTFKGGLEVSLGELSISGGRAIANTGLLSLDIRETSNQSRDKTILRVGNATANASDSSETVGSLFGGNRADVYLYNNTLTINQTRGTSFGGTIADKADTEVGDFSGSLTKNGAGTLLFTGKQAYSGETNITEGVLAIRQSDALDSSSKITVGGAPLQDGNPVAASLGLSDGLTFSRDITVKAGGGIFVGAQASATASGVISGTDGFVKRGEGSLDLAGNNTYSGATTIEAGALSVSGSIVSNEFVVGKEGTFTVGETGSVNKLTSLGTSSSTGTIKNLFVQAGTFDLGGTVEENATVEGGTLRVLGRANVNEIFTVSGGSVIGDEVEQDGKVIETPAQINAKKFVHLGGTLSQQITVFADEAIELQADATQSQPNTVTVGAELAGGAGVTKTGAGTTRLTNANSFSGATTIKQGTLQAANSGAFSSGRVSLQGGTLGLENGISLGNTVSVDTASAIDVGKDATATLTTALLGSATLSKTGTGNLVLGRVSTRTGDTQLKEGTVTLNDGRVFGTGVVMASDGAKLALANNVGFANKVVTKGNLSIEADEGTAVISSGGGGVSGAGGLTKAGAGEIKLIGKHGYSGETIVEAGTLNVEGQLETSQSVRLTKSGAKIIIHGNSISDTANVALAKGSTFEVAASLTRGAVRETIGSVSGEGNLHFVEPPSGINRRELRLSNDKDQIFSGEITGGGILTKAGSGTLRLSGDNTGFSGNIEINGGKLTLDGSESAGGKAPRFAIKTNGSTLALTNGTTSNAPIVINSNTTKLEVVKGTATQAGSINEIRGPRPLEKIGSGTLILSGENRFTGQATISAGTLSLLGGRAIADATAVSVSAGATLNLGANETIGALLGDGTASIGKHTLTLAGQTNDTAETMRKFGGGLQGSGKLIKQSAGSLDLANARSFTGELEVAKGTLNLAGPTQASTINVKDGTALNATGNAKPLGRPDVQLNNSGRFTLSQSTLNISSLNGGSNASVTLNAKGEPTLRFEKSDKNSKFDGSIFGGGTIDYAGGQTLTLSGKGDFDGALTVSNGLVDLTGPFGALELETSGNGQIRANGDTISAKATVKLSSQTTTRLLAVPQANLLLAGDETIGKLEGIGIVDLGSNTLTVGDERFSLFGGVLQGKGSLIKQGADTLVLFGQNTFTGLTTVKEGTLRLHGGNAIADTGELTIAKGATLEVSARNTEKLAVLNGTGTVVLGAEVPGEFVDALGGNQQEVVVQSQFTRAPLVQGKPAPKDITGPGTLEISSAIKESKFDGAITGQGDLVKSGSGKLTLSGKNTFDGTTLIKSGVLDLTGSLSGSVNVGSGTTFNNYGTAGAVTINSGGVVKQAKGSKIGALSNEGRFVSSGTSTIGAVSNSGSIILSGNKSTSDVLNVNGGLKLGKSSEIGVDVGSDFSSDRISVAGPVSLAGLLSVNGVGSEESFEDATSGRIRGQISLSYTIIDNDGVDATSGSFSKINNQLAFLDATVEENAGDGNDVVLTLTNPNPIPDFTQLSSGANQDGSAQALFDFDYSGDEGQEVLSALLPLTEDDAKSVLQQVTGDGHASVSSTANNVGSSATGTGITRIGSVGTGGTGGGVEPSAYASSQAIESRIDDAFKAVNAHVEPAPAVPTYAFWAEASGSYSSVDGDANSGDFSARSAGLIFGAELLKPDTSVDALFGVFGGYSRTGFDTSTPGFDASANNYHVGAYGGVGATTSYEAGFGLLGALAYTWHDYDTSRAITTGVFSQTASADYDGGTFNAQLRARYGFELAAAESNIVFSPIVGFDFGEGRTDGFSETGAGGLNIITDSSSFSSRRSVLGFEIANTFSAGQKTVKASIGAQWLHEFADVSQTTNLALEGSVTGFTNVSPVQARDSFVINGSANIALTDQVDLEFHGRGDFSDTSTGVTGVGRIKMSF